MTHYALKYNLAAIIFKEWVRFVPEDQLVRMNEVSINNPVGGFLKTSAEIPVLPHIFIFRKDDIKF